MKFSCYTKPDKILFNYEIIILNFNVLFPKLIKPKNIYPNND